MSAEHTVAESDLQRRLRRIIDLRGVAHVARELGLGSREPVLRYLAGLDVQAGTRELIERKLAELGDETAEAEVARELAKLNPCDRHSAAGAAVRARARSADVAAPRPRRKRRRAARRGGR